MATEINTASPLMMFFSALTIGAFTLFGKVITLYQDVHLPPIIIESMQFLSYTGAVTVSFLTVYKFLKERKKNRKNG